MIKLILFFACELIVTIYQSTSMHSFEVFDSEMSKVEVVQGYNASLPCIVPSPPLEDSAVLTLWYIGAEETPIYSYDQRSVADSSAVVWSDEQILGNRARYLPDDPTPILYIFNASVLDARIYRCRVDYQTARSRVAWVNLTVIVPPFAVEIHPKYHPVKIGERNDVICKVYGGSPTPVVFWYQDGQPVDRNFTTKDGIVYNILEIPAQRNDMASPFFCQAKNNDVSHPLIDFYNRNVTCGAISVEIQVENDALLIDGQQADFLCTVIGSNPAPIVTWYLDDKKLNSTIVRVSKNITESRMTLHLKKNYHQAKLVCRAENVLLPLAVLEDLLNLDIAYKPNVSLELDYSLNADDLKEGDDVAFKCIVDANPVPYKIQWLHMETILEHNVSSGIVISGNSLALQSVTSNSSGNYQCLASNVEGDAVSNNITIKIKYSPRCNTPSSVKGIALFELTNITCSVQADPSNVSFSWTFRHSSKAEGKEEAVNPKRYVQSEWRSILSYTPMTQKDYGTLFCYATNSVGRQKIPCKFSLISAGPPEEVSNCSITNITSHSAVVACVPGFNGGLPQRFLLQIRENSSGRNVVNRSSSRPVFLAKSLDPGLSYTVQIVSFNAQGKSPPFNLLLLTLSAAEMHRSLPSMVEPNPFIWVLGVVSGILLVIGVLLIGIWRARHKRGTCANHSVTQVVIKENNPDLLKMETSGEKASETTPLKCVIEDGDSHTEEGGSKSFGPFNELTLYRLQNRTTDDSSFQSYEDDPSRSYFPSSPDVSERTRLTASGHTQASPGSYGGITSGGRSLGGVFFQGGGGGVKRMWKNKDMKTRQATTVRLLGQEGPETVF